MAQDPDKQLDAQDLQTSTGTQEPDINVKEIWKIALEQIQMYVTPQNYTAWFKKTNLIKIESGIATIGCQSNYAREWLDTNHHQLLKKILNGITKAQLDIVFVVQTEEEEDSEEPNKDRYADSTITAEEAPIFNVEFTHQNLLEEAQEEACVNPTYLFENFVVGDSNKLVHAAAEAVAENPGKSYNPLFIWGGVGLGKTHLIHAIANRILNADPNKKVMYCSSETFLNEMVESIREQHTTEFRQNYRKLDLLIIDDIQFISEWERAQQELFHTFNTLYQSGRQIILASDRPPDKIEKLEDRLRSRFQGGMVADISKPNYELRYAIIKEKARQKNIILPEYVLEFIARSYEDNIREMEGALTKIGTIVRLGDNVPTEDELGKILEVDAASKRKKISPREIVRNVCKEFNVSVRDVRGKRRLSEYVVPRQVCMYKLRNVLELPLEQVAKELNRKDHTTVLHAIERVEEMMEEDEEFKRRVGEC